MELEYYLECYRKDLSESVIPFWLKHSLDRQCGGYFTCLDRDGTVYDDKKYMWMQGRQAYMLARLYNQYDRRDELLDAATLGVNFIRKYGKDDHGRVYFSLTREGKPFFYQRKVYGAVYYMMALLEYYKAVGRGDCLNEAVDMFWDIGHWIKDPTLLDRPALAGAFDVSNLSNVMAQAGMVIELSSASSDDRYPGIMQQAIDGMKRHFDPNRRILMENVALDGADITAHPEGRLFNPGHSIEVAWFLLHLIQRLEQLAPGTDNSSARQLAFDALEGSLQFGWDRQYGGLYYLMDIHGKPTLQLESSMKLWWPHTEAIYALILAYKMTGEQRWLDWLEKVHTYAYAHFADKEMGDWFAYCDRAGNLTHTCKGGNYKGFFHVPRFLLMSIQALTEQRSQ